MELMVKNDNKKEYKIIEQYKKFDLVEVYINGIYSYNTTIFKGGLGKNGKINRKK